MARRLLTPDERARNFYSSRITTAETYVKTFGPMADRARLVRLHETVVAMLDQTATKENTE